jgi:hypothetical protein
MAMVMDEHPVASDGFDMLVGLELKNCVRENPKKKENSFPTSDTSFWTSFCGLSLRRNRGTAMVKSESFLAKLTPSYADSTEMPRDLATCAAMADRKESRQ